MISRKIRIKSQLRINRVRFNRVQPVLQIIDGMIYLGNLCDELFCCILAINSQ